MTNNNLKRQIVLDTETTGLNPEDGHRIIEIGCVELINRRLTGQHFHVYLNPERLIDAGAIEVHGISNEFLADKPHFEDIVDDFIAFIRGTELVIHNAPFDVGFINHELGLLKHNMGDVAEYSRVFDTLTYARSKHPGQRNSLDALCKRYSIDNSHRELHGALLDAEILADVYLLMSGGQFSLIEDDHDQQQINLTQQVKMLPADRQALKVIFATNAELKLHQQRLDVIEKADGQCLWER